MGSARVRRVGGALVSVFLVALVALISPTSAQAVGTPPGPVGGVSATAVIGGATIRWSPPADTGSSAVTRYRITQQPGGLTTETDRTYLTSYTVVGLTLDTTYTYTVSAINDAGSGPDSLPSNGVSPIKPPLPPSPTGVAVTVANEAAEVRWDAVQSASPTESYRVTVSPSGQTVTVSGANLSARIDGLTNSTSYTVTVAAMNAIGWGPESAPSSPFAPAPSVPSAPRDLKVVAGQGSVSLSWGAGVDDGGSAITGYAARLEPGGLTASLPVGASSASFDALDPAVSYVASVSAVNALGASQPLVSDPVVPALVVPTTTLVLTDATMSSLSVIHTDGSMEFNGVPAQLASVTPGTILVAGIAPGAPYGLLKKVETIVSGTNTVITTTPASLDDALTSGDISLDQNLYANQVASFTPLQPGVRMTSPSLSGNAVLDEIEITFDKTLYQSSASPISVDLEGVYRLRPSVSFDSSISPTHSELKMDMGWNFETEVSVTAQKSWNGDRRIPLGSMTFQPISFAIGPVPVVLVPRLEISASANGSISVGVMVSVAETGRTGVKVAVTDGKASADPYHTGRGASWKLPQIFGEVSARAGVVMRFELLLYGAGGAIAESFAGVEAKVNTSEDPWWRLSLVATLDVGLGLHSGLSKLLGVDDWKTEDLLVLRNEIVRAPGPFMGVTVSPAKASVPLGGSVSLTVNVPFSPVDTVTWSVPAGCGSIKNSTYKAPTTLPTQGRVCLLTATSAASGLAPESTGTSEVTVGVDLPGAPTNVSATPWQESAFVRWAAPRDTGGSAITKYVITTYPGTYATEIVGQTTGKILGLKPGERYRVFVTAVNQAGEGLPSSPSEEILIPDVEPKPGSVQGWGSYGFGQSLRLFSDVPAPVYDLAGIQKMAAGTYSGYALDSGGSLWSWGGNGWGQLGAGNGDLAPIQYDYVNKVLVDDVVDVAANDSTAFAATADGRAWVWGSVGGYLQLNTQIKAATAPVAVPGLSQVVDIAPGTALRSDGTVWTWGYNSSGQLGDGTTTDRYTPAPVPGLSNVIAITGNSSTHYALTSTGELWAWGHDEYGQVGDGSAETRGCLCAPSPVKVSLPVAIKSISGEGLTPLALGEDRKVYAWGWAGSGQLGDGTVVTRGCGCRPTPGVVPALTDVVQAAIGNGNEYAMTADGTVYAWGYGGNGSLGAGSFDNSLIPTKVPVLGPVGSIYAGGSIAYAVRKSSSP